MKEIAFILRVAGYAMILIATLSNEKVTAWRRALTAGGKSVPLAAARRAPSRGS